MSVRYSIVFSTDGLNVPPPNNTRVEGLEKEGVYLPPFQILNPRHPSLRVCHHLTKEVREAGFAKLCISSAIEVSVVDSLAIGGDSKAS